MSWNFNKIIVSENINLPVNWRSIFPADRIFVEIGFGNGEFLEYLAKTYSDVLIVGIEVSQWCAAKGARRALAEGLDNVRIMHGDARFLLTQCFPPESVERVYMNFPCPWPKTRHASRRVTVPLFSDLLDYLLMKGGTFELATDVDWYASDAAETIAARGLFKADPVEINPVRPYVTKYERKWKSMGKDTWHLKLHKIGHRTTKIETEDDWPMDITTEAKDSVCSILAKLKNAEGPGVGNKGHWIFRETFYSEAGDGLVLVITTDEGFEQHFYIKVIPHQRGIVIKIDSVGHPYRTPSMRGALLFAMKAASNEDNS